MNREGRASLHPPFLPRRFQRKEESWYPISSPVSWVEPTVSHEEGPEPDFSPAVIILTKAENRDCIPFCRTHSLRSSSVGRLRATFLRIPTFLVAGTSLSTTMDRGLTSGKRRHLLHPDWGPFGEEVVKGGDLRRQESTVVKGNRRLLFLGSESDDSVSLLLRNRPSVTSPPSTESLD